MNRQITVAEFIDYLSQFDPSTQIFPDMGPDNKGQIMEGNSGDVPFIVLDQIDFRIED